MSEELRTTEEKTVAGTAGESSTGKDGSSSQGIFAWADKLTMADAKAFWHRLGPLGPLAATAMILTLLGDIVLIAAVAWVAPWLKSQGHLGLAIFVLGSAIMAGLALLPVHPQSALAGWVFGARIGSAAAITGVAGACLIGYLIAQRASGDRVVRLISEQPKWKAVYDALLGSSSAKALLIVILVRLPSSPFAITNLVMAACRIRLWVYFLGTVVGIAPRVIVLALLGAQFAATDFRVPKDLWLFIAGLVAAVAAVAIIGTMANHAVKRVTAGMTPDGPK